MLVTEHFLFLHTPKTGGIWVRDLCAGSAPASWKVRDLRGSPHQHKGLGEVPPRFRHLPTIAAVRNPWEWYVSWFFFNKRHTRIAKEASSKRWEARFQDCPETVHGFQRALPRLLESGSHQWQFLTDGDRRVDHVVRHERLREGVVEAIEATGAPVTDAFRQAALRTPKANMSKHRPYRDYYTPELQALVGQHDAALLAEHGYAF